MLTGLRDESSAQAVSGPSPVSAATLRPVAPARTHLRPVAEADWQSLPGGLQVRGRQRAWADIVAVQLDLRDTSGARDEVRGRVGLRDGTSLRLAGPRARWLALLEASVDRGAGGSDPAGLAEPSPPVRVVAPRPARAPGLFKRLWFRVSGGLGAGCALALIVAAELLFPTRTLIETHVWFPDFVWVVPLVAALEIARAARLRRLRGRARPRP